MSATQSSPVVSFYDRFVAEVQTFSNGNTMPLCDVLVSKANLYSLSLSILAECDRLSKSSTLKDTMLLQTYNKVTCTVSAKKTVDVSVRSIALTIVDLYDRYSKTSYLWNTMLRNWRWSDEREKTDDEKFTYDPRTFSKSDMDVTLGSATMILLVKALRIYLMETVKRFFPRKMDASKWDAGYASYRTPDNKVVSTATYCDYTGDLLEQYRKIVHLSPELTEFKSSLAHISEVVKLEKQKQRLEEEKRGALEYGVIFVDHVNESQLKTTTEITARSVPKGGHVKQFFVTGVSSDTLPATAWTGKNLPESLKPVPAPRVEKVVVPISSPVEEDSVLAPVVVNEEAPQKRVIKSGAQKAKLDDSKGWKQVTKKK